MFLIDWIRMHIADRRMRREMLRVLFSDEETQAEEPAQTGAQAEAETPE